ncbi:MAG TPA: hypothetical protein VEJ18_12215 [Planctomycetota bacterium]|nr:hypothetical protein [Planctomycetota bacterium]
MEALVGEGICLDRRGRHADALILYFEALEPRTLYEDPRVAAQIVALYRRAGREDAPREELVRRDAAFWRRGQALPGTSELDRLHGSPTRPVRRIFEGEPPPEGGPDVDTPFPPLPERLTLP